MGVYRNPGPQDEVQYTLTLIIVTPKKGRLILESPLALGFGVPSGHASSSALSEA